MQGAAGAAYTPTEQDETGPVHVVPRQARVPGGVLVALMSAAWLWVTVTRWPTGMADWGVSGAALRRGRYETLLTSMFAHAGAWHLGMNMSVLYPLSGLLVLRMGRPPAAWLRFLALFFASGIVAELTYLALDPFGSVPMLGASGAIYGLIGTLLRLNPEHSALAPIRSRETGRALLDLLKSNAVLFAILAIPALLSGKGGGLAWQAHLGGLVFGLTVGPRVLRLGPPPLGI